MKKFLLFILTFCICCAFAGCKTNSAGKTEPNNEYDIINENSPDDENEPQEHLELPKPPVNEPHNTHRGRRNIPIPCPMPRHPL